MEEIEEEEEGAALPRRRSSNASSSPDFEFWMVGNPSSFPPPQLLSADELFSDGVLLPLHLLLHPNPNPNHNPSNPPELQPQPQPEKLVADIVAPTSSGSKRWRDIFRVAGEKRGEEKERRRDRKSGAAASASASAAAAAAAEIGINIWPFARSRSAGNARGAGAGSGSGSGAAAGRKASSAPCSRSNSRGESAAARRWAASPGRAGVHVGRSSPVWQMRRTRGPDNAHAAPRDKDKDKDKTSGWRRSGGSGARVLSLNVNTCIGYRSHVTCRGNSADKKTADEVNASAAAGGGSNGSLFILRNLFSSKKVY